MLPPLTPACGALLVSPATTRTWSSGTPSVSAAIAAIVVSVPVMST
jgi:hypothetical protein